MALTEQDRIKLYRHFEADMGEELATKMMDSLPPAGWGEVATKQDIEELRVATKQDIEDLRLATKQDIEDLRLATKQDIEDLRLSTKQDIEDLRKENRHEFEAVRKDIAWFREYVEVRIEGAEHKLGRQMYKGMLAQTFGLAALIVTLSGIVHLF